MMASRLRSTSTIMMLSAAALAMLAPLSARAATPAGAAPPAAPLEFAEDIPLNAFALPLDPRLPRPHGWPARLSFDVLNEPLTAEALAGAWQIVYLCDGAPIPLSRMTRAPWVYSGASPDMPFIEFIFDGERRFARRFAGSVEDIMRRAQRERRDEQSCFYSTAPIAGSSDTNVHITGCEGMGGARGRTVQARETGEIALEFERTDSARERFCDPGQRLKYYLVRAPAGA